MDQLWPLARKLSYNSTTRDRVWSIQYIAREDKSLRIEVYPYKQWLETIPAISLMTLLLWGVIHTDIDSYSDYDIISTLDAFSVEKNGIHLDDSYYGDVLARLTLQSLNDLYYDVIAPLLEEYAAEGYDDEECTGIMTFLEHLDDVSSSIVRQYLKPKLRARSKLLV